MKTLFCACTVLVPCCRADLVILHNGDRVSGRVESPAQGFKIQTEWAGAVHIDWRPVEQVSTDQAVEVEAESGLRWAGARDPTPGSLVILTEPVPVAVPFDRVGPWRPFASAGDGSSRRRLTGSCDRLPALTPWRALLSWSAQDPELRSGVRRLRISSTVTARIITAPITACWT